MGIGAARDVDRDVARDVDRDVDRDVARDVDRVLGVVMGTVAVMDAVRVVGVGMNGGRSTDRGGSRDMVVSPTITTSRSFTRFDWCKSFSMKAGLTRQKSCSPGWRVTRRCWKVFAASWP